MKRRSMNMEKRLPSSGPVLTQSTSTHHNTAPSPTALLILAVSSFQNTRREPSLLATHFPNEIALFQDSRSASLSLKPEKIPAHSSPPSQRLNKTVKYLPSLKILPPPPVREPTRLSKWDRTPLLPRKTSLSHFHLS